MTNAFLILIFQISNYIRIPRNILNFVEWHERYMQRESLASKEMYQAISKARLRAFFQCFAKS